MPDIKNPSERDAINQLRMKYFIKDEEFEISDGKVTKLNLYFKELNSIPKAIQDLTNLIVLDLGYNKIAKIEGIGNLSKLKLLNLEYNQIRMIEGLDGLYQLEELNLYGNQINKIEGLGDLNNLKKLDLGKNPLDPDSVKLLKEGVENAVNSCKSNQSKVIQDELIEEFISMELLTPSDLEFALKNLEKRSEEMERKNFTTVDMWIQEQLVKLNEMLLDHENISKLLRVQLQEGRQLTDKEMLLQIKLPPSQLEHLKNKIQKVDEINIEEKDIIWLDDYTIKILEKFQKRDPTLAELVVNHGMLLDSAKKLGKYLKQKGLITEFAVLPKSEEKTEPLPYVIPMEFDSRTPPKIFRGFNFAGDCFKFFIKVENPTNFVFNDVNVKLILPETLLLDKKSTTNVFHLGEILPRGFKSAYYFLYPKTCQRSKINAQVEYKDIKGDYHVQLMAPFEIDTCFGGIKPKKISKEEFFNKLEVEEKRSLKFPLKKGTTRDEVWNKIRAQTTLELIDKAEDELRLFGKNLEGQDVGIDTSFIEKEGKLYFESTVFGEAMKNIFGVLCDIHNALIDLRDDHIIISEYICSIISDIQTKYEEYEKITINVDRFLQNQRVLEEKYFELVNQGNVGQTRQIKLELLKLNQAIRKSTLEQNSILESISDSIINIIENQENSEETIENMFLFIKERLKTDWERIKGTWQEYKAGKIDMKELIKRAFKGAGKKLIDILPRTVPALL